MGKYNLEVLDCTLRDGGYINDWKFGHLKIQSIVSRLDESGIDIIEIGFLDKKAAYDKNRTMFPTLKSISETLGHCIPKKSKLFAMIEFGNFDAGGLVPQAETVVDGIRLIFSKGDIDEAMKLGEKIKDNGYTLCLNPVALSSYPDIEILELIEKINKIEPEAVSIVDTYGTMFWQNVVHYVDIFDHNLKKEIKLGFHSHNNLQVSNANTIEFIRMGILRDIIVDVSILGMGRRSGNACTEVICSYLEKFNIKDVNVDQVLECAYSEIAVLYGEQSWGYDLDNMIAAIFECSASWVEYYLKKNTITIADIRKIIASLPKYERSMNTFFSKELAEQKYLELMKNEIDDSLAYNQFENTIRGKKILLLCPGNTLNTHKNEIEQYIKNNEPLVISMNFIPEDFSADYCFVSNPKRATLIGMSINGSGNSSSMIITSNIFLPTASNETITFNYKTLYDDIDGDNNCIMMLRILKKIGNMDVAIAGFDGYSGESIYVDDSYKLHQPGRSNDKVISQIRELKRTDGNISISLITPSDYSEEL